ncbi:MAG TPA: RpiB/LacA/LacB family sugar-phosphate isomerase [Victivallales bacterium]|nr:RpiB/LacA/LacB family sugar-phosphate isomerase [Victivallales bacterium]
MKIAVINETSSANRNSDILNALEGRGHDIFNLGMTVPGAEPELTYIHTGLLTGLLLNLKKVDLVIGGCGTGQGFLNSALQYPGVFCGLIQNPMDAWLFAQINGGNCISLALQIQYGWAADVNLKFIFDKLFSFENFGSGYPENRKKSQEQSRNSLIDISHKSHKKIHEILNSIDKETVVTALNYPGVPKFIDLDSIDDELLRKTLFNI